MSMTKTEQVCADFGAGKVTVDKVVAELLKSKQPEGTKDAPATYEAQTEALETDDPTGPLNMDGMDGVENALISGEISKRQYQQILDALSGQEKG